jgi:hypothetical protein
MSNTTNQLIVTENSLKLDKLYFSKRNDIETVIQSCISQDQQERLAELAASGSSS